MTKKTLQERLNELKYQHQLNSLLQAEGYRPSEADICLRQTVREMSEIEIILNQGWVIQ